MKIPSNRSQQTAKDSKLFPHLAAWLNADKQDYVGPNFLSVFPECIHPVREKLAGDPHRPGYHFLPPTGYGWDVEGPIQFDGRYHLFYLTAPHGAKPSEEPSGPSECWGHAVSEDLVHWHDLPIALAPQDENGPHGYDNAGIYTGSTVINNGVPTIIYNSARIRGKSIATSHDGMVTWKRHPDNPVIPARGAGEEPLNLDVFAWWDEDDQTWYALIGGKAGGAQNDAGQNVGTTYLFQSDNLVNWRYLNPLLKGKSPAVSGEQWDMSHMFKLGDKHVLLITAYPKKPADGREQWDNPKAFDMTQEMGWIGRFSDHRFVPESEAFVLDPGGYYGCAMSFEDDKNRRIIFGLVWEGNSPWCRARDEAADLGQENEWPSKEDPENKTPIEWWSNIYSLPRMLTLRPDGILGQEPVEELKSLRRQHWQYERMPITESGSNFVPDPQGDMLEIIAVIDPGDADAVGIKFLCSPDRKEQTLFIYDRKKREFIADQTHASLDPETLIMRKAGSYPNLPVYSGDLDLPDDEPLELHVFVDRSVIEVFPNSRFCMTQRVYPTRADSKGIDVFARGGDATLISLDAWQLQPIWPVTSRQ